MTTHWSVVLRAGASPTEDSRNALNSLIEAYWFPLYAFARDRGNRHHDAMDLTQGFLTHLLIGHGLESISPTFGRFRSFLIASFKNFMANELRASKTLRRGGAVVVASLSASDFESRYDRQLTKGDTPEIQFERHWVESLLERAGERLAGEYQLADKQELYELLKPHLTFRDDSISRAEIGQRLNLSVAAVSMSLHRMRRRFGEILREEVAATVDESTDVDDELRTLLAIVGRSS